MMSVSSGVADSGSVDNAVSEADTNNGADIGSLADAAGGDGLVIQFPNCSQELGSLCCLL